MDLKAYIESGVLELYALGLLDEVEQIDVERMLSTQPSIREEFEDIQSDLELFAYSNRIEPPAPVQKLVIDSIVNLQKEKEMSLADLPLINRYSSHLNWLKLIENFDLPTNLDDRFIKVLRNDKKVTQLLVASETDIEEEIHDAAYESFLILSGHCKCTIGGAITLMGPGDFMEIPLHQPHDVVLTQKPVIAILQLINID